jgi:hypothetical protein
MGSLQHGGDGGGFEHCVRCGALAAGPCARCRRPVCGDCCVLTEGGATVWAICLACDKGGGRDLRRGWLVVLGWLLGPILLLLLLVIVLGLIAGR